MLKYALKTYAIPYFEEIMDAEDCHFCKASLTKTVVIMPYPTNTGFIIFAICYSCILLSKIIIKDAILAGGESKLAHKFLAAYYSYVNTPYGLTALTFDL